MKKLMTLLLIATFSLLLVACNNEEEKKELSTSYVNLEINPGVEFVVDGEGQVVAANGTNDDGKTLIINVSFEGMDLETAINVVLKEASDSGYLIDASYNSELVSREIKVSIDAENEEYISNINDVVSETVDKYIDENDIAAVYSQQQAKGREYLEAIVKRYNPMITDEELAALTYDELLAMVELATIEKSQMATVALEECYLNFKETEFKFAYKQELAAELSKVNPIIAAAYNMILTNIKTAMDLLNQLEYDLYVSEDSQYLKLLNQLNSYKDEVIHLNAQVAVNENVTNITAEIEAKNELIDEIKANIQTIMDKVRVNIETARTQLNTLYTSLEELESKITNIDYEAILTQVEVEINNAKTGLCSSFEAKYSSEITNINSNVSARKEALEGQIAE